MLLIPRIRIPPVGSLLGSLEIWPSPTPSQTLSPPRNTSCPPMRPNPYHPEPLQCRGCVSTWSGLGPCLHAEIILYLWNNLSRDGVRLLSKAWTALAQMSSSALFLACLQVFRTLRGFYRHFLWASLYFKLKREMTSAPSLPAISRHMLLARTLEQTKQDLPRKYIPGFHLVSLHWDTRLRGALFQMEIDSPI